MSARRIERSERGFTLLEVMIALALLGFALVVLMRSTAGNIRSAQDARMMGVATDLARAKMYELEETLIKDGFSDTDQLQLDPKPFDAEGWPDVTYSYKIEVVELPSWDVLQAMAKGEAVSLGSGSVFGSAGSALGSAVKPSLLGSDFQTLQDFGVGSNDPLSRFQNSAMYTILSQFGGGGSGGDIFSGTSALLIQSQYSTFQQILKDSVRKVTLNVTYKVLGKPETITLVCFYTDPAAMDQVLNGLGAQDLGDTSNGSGSASGSNTSSTKSGSNSK